MAHLAHKTITISDEAYRALKRLKKPNESFTQVILRLAHTKRTGQELLAFLKKIGPKSELADAIDAVYRERQLIKLHEAGA